MFSTLNAIKWSVPKGSLLGSVLYVLFTADLPATAAEFTTVIFADDTAILAPHHDSLTASKMLQNSLNSVSDWLRRLRIKVNVNKSIHVTFTLKS